MIAELQAAAANVIEQVLHIPLQVARRHVAELADQVIACADGELTGATLTLTKAGVFTAALAHDHYWLVLADAGSGTIIPGCYEISCRTSDNAVVLATDPRTAAAIHDETDPVDVVVVVGELARLAAIGIQSLANRRQLLMDLLPAIPEPVWPAEADVADGVKYGPTGDDYEGTLE